MPKKVTKKTKSKIVTAAWKLFYEQGYENTTIEEIIEESGTSRGSFYDYFEGKELPAKSYIPLYVVDHGNVGEFWDFGDTD